jgi:magnesium chelatase family protein
MGVDGQVVEIEAKLLPGLNKFTIVGLPDRTIVEAKERIISAIVSSGLEFPFGQLIVNLSPAAIAKHGSGLELAICLALVSLMLKKRDLLSQLKEIAIIGELGLDGSVKPTISAAAQVVAAKELNFKGIILPAANYQDTQFVPGIKQFPVRSVKEVVKNLLESGNVNGLKASSQYTDYEDKSSDPPVHRWQAIDSVTLRVLMIAATGRHHLLLDGPPGCGKTTLLSDFDQLLPRLSISQRLSVYKIHNLQAGIKFTATEWPQLRAPHQTISAVALLGGGSTPLPGEVSLAHYGVLLLDEINEFNRYTLESLRQPIEQRNISISRASYKVLMPCDFQLLATRNPCQCGWYGTDKCTCTLQQVHNYQKRLSGALLDRIHIKYRLSSTKNLHSGNKNSCDLKQVRGLIEQARDIQRLRYENESNVECNAHFDNYQQQALLKLEKPAVTLTEKLSSQYQLSLRSIFNVKKIARSIADLEQEDTVSEAHIYEAYNLNV